MEEVYLLWFLSISMLICSFLSGLVPLAFRLSDNKSRLLALLGSGILVGTALSIIIPEGIDSLYGHETQIIPIKQPAAAAAAAVDKNILTKQAEKQHHYGPDDSLLETTSSVPDNSHEQTPPNRTKQDMTWIVGMSLIVGFVLMLLIEQFSIYQSGIAGHHHHHHHHHQHSSDIIHTNHTQSEYTLACQDDDTDIGLEEDEKAIVDETTSETKPIKISMRANAVDTSINSSDNTPATIVNSNPNRYYDHSRHLAVGHKPKTARVTPTLGLVIHAAADGIALGAAATTSHRDVEMIIFLAIMLHKAPAAFSLVVLLLHNGLRAATIRRHLLAFSLSAPIAAIFTYYGLSQSGKEALRRNNATGIAMLFSAGTFLFVATVHVLPELIQNKLLTPREMFFLLGGAFLPLLLTQMI